MTDITYIKFDDINPQNFLLFLNNEKIRKHLIDHEFFTLDSLKSWMDEKIQVDSSLGCRVRGIIHKNELVGWCGIQLENNQYEIAIIINDTSWGLGKYIFNDMMGWAKELGHHDIFIHFLHTRPNYKFLNKIAKSVSTTFLFEQKFTTYQIAVK